MNKLSQILIAILIAGFTFSCTKVNSDRTSVMVMVKSTPAKSFQTRNEVTQATPLLKSGLVGASIITVDTFLINIKDIDIELDDQCNDDCSDDCNDDCNDKSGIAKGGDDCDDSHDDKIGIAGPFLIDLLSPEAVNGLPVGLLELPNASYDEVEFKLSRYTLDQTKPIYNRSIYITGKTDGKPMKMWYTGDYDFTIEFPDSTHHFILTGDNLKMYLDFSIENMLTSLSKVDFSSAADRNGNGIIEIGSDDTDGNSQLAHHIIETILNSCYLDDKYDDD